jgi:hypothetical protein
MTRTGPSKKVDATFWQGRLRTALAYHAAAQDTASLADQSTNCSPAVSNAILAAIAYTDSVTAYKAQVVNQQGHASASKLLRSVLGNAFPDAQERRIRRLLGRKDEVQYGVHAIGIDVARQVIADLDAFAAWAHDVLPKAENQG